MANAKRLTVTYQDGREVLVKASPRAQVMAERHFGRSLTDADKVEEMFYLGWCAMTVAGIEHGDFESFLDRIDDVTWVGEDKAAVPTDQAPSPGTSSD